MNSENGLQSVDRVVRLVEIAAAGPVTLSAAAAKAGLNDATALRYFTSLVRHGWIEREPKTRRYRLRIQMFRLGCGALAGRGFTGVVTDTLQRLVDETGETANLAMRSESDVLIVQAVESRHPVRKGASIGERDCWHSSGLGKAILSSLSNDESRRLLDGYEFTPFTKHTITGSEGFYRELDRTRERGFALDDEESAIGLRCVAVPIRGGPATQEYALSVSGPASRLAKERFESVAALLLREAANLEAFLGFDLDRQRSPHGDEGVNKDE